MNNEIDLSLIIKKAYQNSKQKLGFLLDGAFRKHGNTETATGSRFVKPGWFTTQGGVEHLLFADMLNSYEEVSRNGNLLIAKAQLSDMGVELAVTAAVDLSTVDKSATVEVKELGYHPTLTLAGTPVPTQVITLIIELDGGQDPDLAGMGLEGEPVLVTWHPGEALPPSNPHDCEVGDRMTVAKAIEKGWRTACLTA
jgi:hypothetical protein